ncbi:MAG: glycosyltransferase family 4 protein, partial [Candidatus Aminicenantes bacterium]|nr:glycosyltransferase family 4 protein [Candidatus Aminicenantes bacterium]
PPIIGVACAVLKVLRQKKYIYAIFDVYPDTAERLGAIKERGLVAKTWDWWNGKILKNAAAVVVLGQEMRDIILRKGKDRSSLAGRIRLIHVWSDDRQIVPVAKNANPLRHKWNLNGRFVVSYSGNMGRFHDMETIMKAARELADNKDICFLFIGEGQKKKWMEEYAQRWNLTNCRFRTYVPREELGLSLACADVGLVSLMPGQSGLSEPSKTFGILAAGVPVIAVVPSQSEIVRIVEEYGCGIIVDPNDVQNLAHSILRLHSAPDEVERLGRNAVRAVREKYNLKHAAMEYFSLIRSHQHKD